MKQRVLTVLLCMMLLISATTISALGAPADTAQPLSISFETPVWAGQKVTLDVTLSNSSAAAVSVSLIDLHLTVTGAYAGFTASNGSGVLAKKGDGTALENGTVLLYREALDTTLSVPAKAGETDGALVLGKIEITAGADGKAGLAQAASETNNGVMSPGYQYSLLGSVTAAEYSLTGGVTVSGLVKGYNSSYAPVAKLYAATDTAHDSDLYTAAVSSATAAGEQYTWTVSFANVAPGAYDLVVTKAAHLTYTVTGVVVADSAIDLTADPAKAYSTMSMLAGDVDGDGSILEIDVSVIRYQRNINKTIEQADNKLTDINGDGSVLETDVSIVRYSRHINKSAEDCTYAFMED